MGAGGSAKNLDLFGKWEGVLRRYRQSQDPLVPTGAALRQQPVSNLWTDNRGDSLQTVKMEFFLDHQALLSCGIYHHLTPAKRATQRIAVVAQGGLQCGFPGSHFVSDLYQLHSAQNSVVPCRV